MINYTTEIIYENIDSLKKENSKKLNIIHFNDVYNIESRDVEPVGGSARFITAIEDLISKNEPTLVFFSGDAISPSSISMLCKGKQMIEILNNCHISCACLGNHDFDFGLEILLKHIKNSNFPWLISNVFDAESKLPLGNVKDRLVIDLGDIRLGIIGLVEEEWMATLSTINYDDIIYESYVDIGKKLALELRTEEKCDIVIALTHMRWNNDSILAEHVPEIDLFLGGHDHDYVVEKISGRWVLKSGTDFREFSLVELNLDKNTKEVSVDKIEKYIIDSKIPEKREINDIVNSYLENISKELDVLLGHMNVELEGRFSYVRTQETNLGNFICDILLEAVNADCAFLNSGSLRSDCVHPIGDFRVRDLKKILPFLDENVVLQVSGAKLHQALENGVSQYPKLEGRFLQVSGIHFAFDPSKPSGSRIDPKLIQIQNEYIDLNKDYAVATKLYLKQGKDGFDCLVDCPVLVDSENIPVLFNVVENHFKTVESLKKAMSNSESRLYRYRPSLCPLVVRDKLINELSEDPTVIHPDLKIELNPSHENLRKLNFHKAANFILRVLSHKNHVSKKHRQIITASEKFQSKMADLEEKALRMAPQVENRIIMIRDHKHYVDLLNERNQQMMSHLNIPK